MEQDFLNAQPLITERSVGIHARKARELCLAKTSFTCKMNDLAQSSIRIFPVKFLP
jgi:hypothetical protein